MLRTHYAKELLSHLGEDVVIAGFVENVKELPNLRFIVIRDRSGLAQVTVHKKNSPEEIVKETEKLNQQDVVSVSGTVLEKQLAKIGPEVRPQKITILSRAATPLPIDISGEKPSQLDTRLDFRAIDLRNPRNYAIFKIESKLVEGFEEYLRQNGFIQVYTPAIIGGVSEGGSEVFKIDYYGSKASLRQDIQLHRQLLMAAGFDRMFELGPNWRAELSHTPNHLSEHRSCVVEQSYISDEADTERTEEQLITYALEKVSRECKEELDVLEKKINVPSLPFPEVRFPEIYDILKEYGKVIPRGEDLNREAEQILAKHMKEKNGHDFFFINRFPFKIKPFYVMRVDEEPEYARSVDLVFKGLELSSGGQREHRYEKLMEQIKIKEITEDISWFTENFKYGVPPHGGFSIGIERATKQLLGMENAKEASLFPRTPERLKP
ncbi:MAG: aspartate--tRNA(Asn) ligase [Nitrososphaerales archaeon]